LGAKSVSSASKGLHFRWSDSNNNNIQGYVCMPTGKRSYHKKGSSICHLSHDESRLSSYRKKPHLHEAQGNVGRTDTATVHERQARHDLLPFLLQTPSSQPPPQEWTGVAEAPLARHFYSRLVDTYVVNNLRTSRETYISTKPSIGALHRAETWTLCLELYFSSLGKQ
jgi:hypothetical protein